MEFLRIIRELIDARVVEGAEGAVILVTADRIRIRRRRQ
jgi:hypothetical protein